MKDIKMDTLPPCQVHEARGVTKDAEYDTRTRIRGVWMYLCKECFDDLGVTPSNHLVLRGPKVEQTTTELGRTRPLSYGEWTRKVNAVMVGRVGVGMGDIEDWGWRDAYDDGMSPEDAVTGALEDSDIYGGSGL